MLTRPALPSSVRLEGRRLLTLPSHAPQRSCKTFVPVSATAAGSSEQVKQYLKQVVSNNLRSDPVRLASAVLIINEWQTHGIDHIDLPAACTRRRRLEWSFDCYVSLGNW